MPKYIFTCDKCRESKQMITSSATETISCPQCSNSMHRQFPSIAGQQVYETVDPYTNVKWTKDQQEEVKDRRDSHYWEIEVPRMIETYSLETCIENGWLKYNDKGELIINKPPKKR